MQRTALVRAEADPAELQELSGGQVRRQRLDEAGADERQLHEGAEGDELVGHRLDDGLLALAAREVVLGRVEPVLPHARVDQRPLAVHRLRPLLEPPAGPLLAARLGRVGAVEAVGEDRLRHVDLDPAERVDHLSEVVEVDEDDVVRPQARERGDGLHRERRPAELEGGVDLVRALAGDVDAQVARDREIRHPVPLRVGAHEQDRVGAAEVLARGGAVAVGAEQHDQGRVRQHQPLLGRELRLDRLRQPLVRLLDALPKREVAGDDPDDQEHAQQQRGEPDPAAPARLPRLPRAARLAPARPFRTRRRRHLPLCAAALVEPVGLLCVRHSGRYGSRVPWALNESSVSISAGRRSPRARSTPTATATSSSRCRRRSTPRRSCSRGSNARSSRSRRPESTRSGSGSRP